MPSDRDIPVSRAVGRFFGHLWGAIKSDPGKDRAELKREVEEQPAVGPAGERVTLRRTTIEEIEIEPPSRDS